MPPASGRWRVDARFSTISPLRGIPMESNSRPTAAGDTPALHPCYSPAAHRHFARLHLAVAPKCNIQCNYCNRKYHCSNESRPGVVAELLEPDQAIRKALAVGAAIPHLAVIGVAGPGDPLANPEPVFTTLRELREQAPDLLLCLSTNGLALPEHADTLAEHGIHHVTITINCVDPDIGTQIYPWIVWQGRRLRGREAAATLILSSPAPARATTCKFGHSRSNAVSTIV